eukprot:6191132-Pleurochrysis_carterae.AAC.1
MAATGTPLSVEAVFVDFLRRLTADPVFGRCAAISRSSFFAFLILPLRSSERCFDAASCACNAAQFVEATEATGGIDVRAP